MRENTDENNSEYGHFLRGETAEWLQNKNFWLMAEQSSSSLTLFHVSANIPKCSHVLNIN